MTVPSCTRILVRVNNQYINIGHDAYRLGIYRVQALNSGLQRLQRMGRLMDEGWGVALFPEGRAVARPADAAVPELALGGFSHQFQS